MDPPLCYNYQANRCRRAANYGQTNSMSAIIQVRELTKQYRTYDSREGVLGSLKDLFHRRYRWLTAVDGISLEVEEGEMLGYIGPNGAGKSTSIKMLTGILKPTSGEISVWGFHPFRDRKSYTRHIGVVFGQRTQLWWDIAVRESFKLLAKIYEVPEPEYRQRMERLTEILQLDDFLGTAVRKLSLGQRMRCDLAASLIHNPKVLFLDEPTIGLDAVAKDRIRGFLRQVNQEFGTTILLTTHDLREIEELCRRILVLDRGRIIYDGGIGGIKAMPGLTRRVVVDFTREVSPADLSLLERPGVGCEAESGRRVVVTVDPRETTTADVVKQLLTALPVADLTVSEPDIEEVVMKIYREGGRPQ